MWSNEAFGDTETGRYFIEKENIWGSQFRVSKNGERIGNFHYNWGGRVNIDLVDGDGKLFQVNLKYRGFFNTRFEVYLDNNIHLFTMRAYYERFRMCYDVEVHRRPDINFSIDELMGLLTYGAQFYMRASGIG